METNKCKCGGTMDNEDSEWLGEDHDGVGHTRVTEVCTRCGKRHIYILRGT